MTAAWPQLLPLLTHIQAHLGEDLGLAVLAKVARQSQGHLQRSFQALVGESPKRYVARLRSERAAFHLLVRDATILEIALDCGYANPETFTRAFRRRFGITPRTYRAEALTRSTRRVATGPASSKGPYSISATSVRRLRPAHLAFVRHVGPYEAVPDTLFDRLENWAVRHGIRGPRIWMGIGLDAPGICSPDRLRFDAALVVPDAFRPEREIGYQAFDGGEFAITTHVGPYATLASAYATIGPRVVGLQSVRFIGLPAVELYQTTHVNSRLRLNTTDICLPVQSVG